MTFITTYEKRFISRLIARPSLFLYAGIFWLLAVCSTFGGNLYVPNFSFESPVTQFADPRIDSWQKAAQPASFDTNTFGSWDNLIGVFANPAATNTGSIENAQGNQLAYLFAYPQAAIFQDYNSLDGTNTVASHAFNARFQPGKTYTLTVGLTSSSQEPLLDGSTLQLSLYYRDSASNMVTVAATTVTYKTTVFTNLNHLLDFQVTVPAVHTNDPWASQSIGILIESTVAPNLISGVWDIDDVRLVENIAVPNFSFESVATQFADPRIDSWQKSPQPSTFDTNIFGAWDNLSGVFLNAPSTNADYIPNADGNQLGYLFAYPQVAIFQDYTSLDWSNTAPTHAFNARFQPDRAYTLTVGLTSSREESLMNGSTLLLSLYYRDAASNMVTVGSTVVTFQTNVFTNLNQLLDFKVQVPAVRSTDPWANQNIGIEIESIVPPNLISGVWDVDNVRLTETFAPRLGSVVKGNDQKTSLTIQSEPGVMIDIQASTDLAQPSGGWATIGTVTNTTGSATFIDSQTGLTQRFYRTRTR